METYLDTKQGWLCQLSSKELCVGLMWATSQNRHQVSQEGSVHSKNYNKSVNFNTRVQVQ